MSVGLKAYFGKFCCSKQYPDMKTSCSICQKRLNFSVDKNFRSYLDDEMKFKLGFENELEIDEELKSLLIIRTLKIQFARQIEFLTEYKKGIMDQGYLKNIESLINDLTLKSNRFSQTPENNTIIEILKIYSQNHAESKKLKDPNLLNVDLLRIKSIIDDIAIINEYILSKAENNNDDYGELDSLKLVLQSIKNDIMEWKLNNEK